MKQARSALILPAVFLGLTLSMAASAECTRPESPEIPDGATATIDDMLAAQQSIRSYMDGGNAYLECLQAAHDKQRRATPRRDREKQEALAAAEAERVEKHNAMVEDMEAAAADFNTAREAFNARQQ